MSSQVTFPAAYRDARPADRAYAGGLMPAGTQAELIDPRGNLDRLIPAWRQLAEATGEPNPFFEEWMLRPALAHLPGGHSAKLLAIYQGSQIIGLMPLRIRRHYRGLPVKSAEVWTHIHGFLSTPLLRAGHETAAIEGALAALREQGVFVVRFRHAAADGPFAAALDKLIADKALAASVTRSFERALLATHLDGDAYLEAAVSGKKRKEYRRQARRLGEEGELAFEDADTSDIAAVEGVVLEFMGLEAEGWKGTLGSAIACRPAERRFFHDICRAAARNGKLHPLTMRLEGGPVAAIVNFGDARGLFSFKIAFDETLARFSPGVLLELELTRRACEQGFAFVDSCANPDHPMIDHLWRERRAMRDINVATAPGVPAFLVSLTAFVETAAAHLKAGARTALAHLRRRNAR